MRQRRDRGETEVRQRRDRDGRKLGVGKSEVKVGRRKAEVKDFDPKRTKIELGASTLRPGYQVTLTSDDFMENPKLDLGSVCHVEQLLF